MASLTMINTWMCHVIWWADFCYSSLQLHNLFGYLLLYICVCVCVCVCVCSMYVCMYVHTHTHTQALTFDTVQYATVLLFLNGVNYFIWKCLLLNYVQLESICYKVTRLQTRQTRNHSTYSSGRGKWVFCAPGSRLALGPTQPLFIRC
jgi:hypothetical protein